MKAKTVEECWRIASRAAEAYQRQAHRAHTLNKHALCLAKRDAASRIAILIRVGRRKKR